MQPLHSPAVTEEGFHGWEVLPAHVDIDWAGAMRVAPEVDLKAI